MSDSVQPHRRQPTRLPCPWDSPGKNTGVNCHFLLQCMKVKSESEVAQSCLTLRNPMGCSLPGSSIHGIFQARVLEWGAIITGNYRDGWRMKKRTKENVKGMPWAPNHSLAPSSVNPPSIVSPLIELPVFFSLFHQWCVYFGP